MGSYLSSRADEDDNWKSDARYAMESGTYCVICGGPFDMEGDVYNLDPKEPRYQWLFDFRLLGRNEDLNNHRVTSGNAEPVNTSNIDDIFLSEKAWFSMTGSLSFQVPDGTRTGDIWYNALWYARNSSDTLFPLHEACIETSCKAINHNRPQLKDVEERPSLAILYRLLNTHFLDRHANAHLTDDTANDIFDLCQCSYLYGPRSVLAMTRLEWWGGEYDRFYANPIDVPDLESFVFDVLVASSHRNETTHCPIVTTRKPQGIERLPTEMLDSICCNLPSQSAIKLHRTSKALAMNIPLDNAFWRDSLRSGSLHPHIWDLDTKQIEKLRQESNITFSATGWDWKSVAKLLAMKRFPITGRDSRLDDIPFGFWNRCRIWSIVEEALEHDFTASLRERNDSGIEVRKTCHPVGVWDLEEELENPRA